MFDDMMMAILDLSNAVREQDTDKTLCAVVCVSELSDRERTADYRENLRALYASGEVSIRYMVGLLKHPDGDIRSGVLGIFCNMTEEINDKTSKCLSELLVSADVVEVLISILSDSECDIDDTLDAAWIIGNLLGSNADNLRREEKLLCLENLTILLKTSEQGEQGRFSASPTRRHEELYWSLHNLSTDSDIVEEIVNIGVITELIRSLVNGNDAVKYIVSCTLVELCRLGSKSRIQIVDNGGIYVLMKEAFASESAVKHIIRVILRYLDCDKKLNTEFRACGSHETKRQRVI